MRVSIVTLCVHIWKSNFPVIDLIHMETMAAYQVRGLSLGFQASHNYTHPHTCIQVNICAFVCVAMCVGVLKVTCLNG